MSGYVPDAQTLGSEIVLLADRPTRNCHGSAKDGPDQVGLG
jgi:hypothetical protein